MPKPKPDHLTDGKYGKYNLFHVVNDVNNFAGVYLAENQKLTKKTKANAAWIISIGTKGSGITESINGKKFDREVSDNYADEVSASVKDIKKSLEKKSQEPKYQPYKGQIRFITTMADTQKGSYAEALYEQPYLSEIMSQFNNGPNFGKVIDGKKYDMRAMAGPDALGDTVNPATGEVIPGFLSVYDEFWSNVADLLENEYERQQINKDYTDEKASKNLQDKSVIINKVIQGYEKFASMVDDKGETKYDKFLQGPINHLVGKEIEGGQPANRNLKHSINFMKGEKQAIANGWGMNELSVLGSLNEVYEQAQKLYEKKQRAISQTNYQTAIDHWTEELNKEKENLAKLKKNPPNPGDEKAKAKYDRDVKSAESGIESNERLLNRALQREENDRKEHEKLKNICDKLSACKDEIWNKKVTDPIEKKEASDKYLKVLEEINESDIADLQTKVKKGLGLVNEASKYAFRKPGKMAVPEEAENIQPGSEEYAKLNLRTLTVSYYLDSVLAAGGKAEISSEKTDIKDELDGDVSPDGPDTGTLKKGDLPKIKFKINDNPEVLKKAKNIIQTVSDSAKRIFRESEPAVQAFPNATKGGILLYDIKKGNAAEAMAEDLFINAIASNFGGAGPDIFRVKGEKTRQEPEVIRQYLQDRGIKRPLEGFFKGGNEAIEAEYYKQNAAKKGWTEENEKTYLAKMHSAYETCITNFDELNKIPDEDHRKVQGTKKIFGNSLGHLTGKGTDDETRDVAVFMGGVKWKKKAIENGWGSKDMQFIAMLGDFEGYLDKKIYQMEFAGKGEGDKARNNEKVQALKEWKEKNLDPFKEKFFGKKIESPKDKLEAMSHAERFLNLVSNEKNTDIANVKESIIDVYTMVPFKRAYNNCIDQIEKASSTLAPQTVKKKEINSDYKESAAETQKQLLGFLRNNKENRADVMEDYATLYLKSAFFGQISPDAKPEFYNTKNRDYKAVTGTVNDQISKYGKELIDKLKPRSPEELADFLEYGDHGPAFERINDMAEAAVARRRTENFMNGSSKRMGDQGITLDSAMKGLSKADQIFSLKGTVHNVVAGFEAHMSYRKELSSQIKDQIKNKKEISLDEKRLKTHQGLILEDIAKIDAYLAEKKKKIRKNGGNPKKEEDIELLGKNGAIRYRAMRDARTALVDMYRTGNEFMEKPYGVEERANYKLTQKSFNVEAENFRHDAFNEKFRTIDAKARDLSIEEENRRFKAIYEYNKKEAKQPDDQKELDKLIIDSAEKTLFVETTRSLFNDNYKKNAAKLETALVTQEKIMGMPTHNDQEMEQMKEQQLKFAAENVEASRKNSSKDLTDYGKAIGEFSENGVFKDNSAQFKAFKDNIMAEGSPFREAFHKEILEQSKTKHVNLFDVKQARDKVVENLLTSAKNPEETKKFEKLAREIGAGNIIEKVAEAKKQKDMVLNANKKPERKMGI